MISSHITSDLEKAADYIAYLDNGELRFCLNKDEMLYDYGVVRCTREDYEQLPKEFVKGVRRNHFEYEVLVENRMQIRKKISKAGGRYDEYRRNNSVYGKGESMKGLLLKDFYMQKLYLKQYLGTILLFSVIAVMLKSPTYMTFLGLMVGLTQIFSVISIDESGDSLIA